MKITVKLYAVLQIGRFAEKELDYPVGAHVGDVVKDVALPAEHVDILLVNGRHVAKDGQVTEIAERDEPALGYSIIEAESLDDALALLEGCPMDMRVYEAVPM